MRKTVLYLPSELVKKLKVYVAEQETSMSALARDLFAKEVGWTEEVKTKKK